MIPCALMLMLSLVTMESHNYCDLHSLDIYLKTANYAGQNSNLSHLCTDLSFPHAEVGLEAVCVNSGIDINNVLHFCLLLGLTKAQPDLQGNFHVLLLSK